MLFYGKYILEGRVIFGGKVVSLPPHISAKWMLSDVQICKFNEQASFMKLLFEYLHLSFVLRTKNCSQKGYALSHGSRKKRRVGPHVTVPSGNLH